MSNTAELVDGYTFKMLTDTYETTIPDIGLVSRNLPLFGEHTFFIKETGLYVNVKRLERNTFKVNCFFKGTVH